MWGRCQLDGHPKQRPCQFSLGGACLLGRCPALQRLGRRPPAHFLQEAEGVPQHARATSHGRAACLAPRSHGRPYVAGGLHSPTPLLCAVCRHRPCSAPLPSPCRRLSSWRRTSTATMSSSTWLSRAAPTSATRCVDAVVAAEPTAVVAAEPTVVVAIGVPSSCRQGDSEGSLVACVSSTMLQPPTEATQAAQTAGCMACCWCDALCVIAAQTAGRVVSRFPLLTAQSLRAPA